MPDNTNRRPIEDQVQRLIELYTENPDYFQGGISQVFEEREEEHTDAAPTPVSYGGFLQWCGSKIPLAYAFGICLTDEDKQFLRGMGIKP